MLADGVYQFEVEVSDNRVNPGERARSAKKLSEVILVDHTPPMVRFLSPSDRTYFIAGPRIRRPGCNGPSTRWMPADGCQCSRTTASSILNEKALRSGWMGSGPASTW